MKTKYIKVPVSEGPPEKSGTYDSNLGEVFYNNFRECFEHNDKATDLFPDYWFLEVPDREDEMREMLEKCLEMGTFGDYIENFKQYQSEVKELLNSIKE